MYLKGNFYTSVKLNKLKNILKLKQVVVCKGVHAVGLYSHDVFTAVRIKCLFVF